LHLNVYSFLFIIPVYHKIDFSEMKRDKNTGKREKRLYLKTIENKHQKKK